MTQPQNDPPPEVRKPEPPPKVGDVTFDTGLYTRVANMPEPAEDE